MDIGYNLGTPSKLVPALIAAKRKMGPAVKDSLNPRFGAFVSLAGAIEAAIPALHEYGLDVVQFTQASPPALVTMLVHESGECIVGHYPLDPGKEHDPQALGAAMTYARRYTLMAMCGLAPEDDDGERASARPEPTAPKAPPPQRDLTNGKPPYTTSSAPSSPAQGSSPAVPKPAGGPATPRKILTATVPRLQKALADRKFPDDAQSLAWLRAAAGEPGITGIKDLTEVGAQKAIRAAEAGE